MTFDPSPCLAPPHTKAWAHAITQDVNNLSVMLREKYGEKAFDQYACLLFGAVYPITGGEHIVTAGYLNGPMISGLSALCIHATAITGWKTKKHPYGVTVQKMLRGIAENLIKMEISGTENLELPKSES